MSRMSSLEDLRKRQEKEEEENKKENQYFAGGLDNRGGGSGLAVQAPSGPGGSGKVGGGGGKDGGDNLMNRIVERGMQDSRDMPPPSSSSSGGGENVETIEITLYRNGFTVNNGTFRDIHAPESQRFLHSLQRGEVPDEIRANATGTGPRELDVKLTSKIEEDYVPPAYIAFSGSSNTLGGQSSNEAFVFSQDLLRGLPIPVVDESQPTINIQLRTPDNKRIKLRVNANLPISSLAALILKETNNQGKPIRFTLNAGFPPKDITDPVISVTEAGFSGASVSMKLA